MRAIHLSILCLLIAPVVQADVVFVDLGTAAPPAMVGPVAVTPFDRAAQAAVPDGTTVSELPGLPFGGKLQVTTTVTKATVPSTWGTWSHGYQGPVFVVAGNFFSITFVLPRFTTGFYVYAQPRSFGNFTITATAHDGTSSGPIAVSGNGGAHGYGFYASDGDELSSITVDAPQASGGLAVGEFGIANQVSSCALVPIHLGDEIDGVWTSDCQSLDYPPSFARYFSFSLSEPMGVEIQLESHDQCPVVLLFYGPGFFGNWIDGASCQDAPIPQLNVPLAAGDYTIEATNYGFGSSGTFTLRLLRGGSCISDERTLCIDDDPGDRRFEVRVSYQTVQGGGASGNGQAVQLKDHLPTLRGGFFWFFDPDNPELLVKVLNACEVDGHYWVFWSAGTNVGMTVTVTDTLTDVTRTYANDDLHPALPVQDTRAFDCD